jgi:pimeloyl-ACP methyl ester carboxylesterase
MKERQTTVTTSDNVRLTVQIYEPDGDATPVRDLLLLHGWPNAGRVWAPLANNLIRGANYRIIAPDLRGFGNSEKTATGYTCARFADDILEIAAALELSNYVIVGHSMSGKLAQVVGARQPSGLAGLALVAPVPLAAGNVPEEKRASQRTIRGDADKTREMLTNFAARPLREERLNFLVEDGLSAAPEAWDSWIDTMREEDLSSEAAKITVPTCVFAGAKDPLRTPDALKTAIVDRIAGATLQVLPNDGHLPHVEESSALALLLVNFFDSLPKAKTA